MQFLFLDNCIFVIHIYESCCIKKFESIDFLAQNIFETVYSGKYAALVVFSSSKLKRLFFAVSLEKD